jgi:predicted phosphate transport protein (TIGR00153 family)
MWVRSSDEKFYRAFNDLADRVCAAAKLLVEMSETPAKAYDHSREIKRLEHEGDEIVKVTSRALRGTWITPFDRADIHELVSRLDDALDVINAIAGRYQLFNLTEMPPHTLDFAKLIVEASGEVVKAVALLRNMKRADETVMHVEHLDRLESEGDGLFRSAIAELYNGGGDPVTIMKHREIYDKLESALDIMSDVGNAIEGVVLEYA